MSEITHDSIKKQRLGRGLNSLISNATTPQSFSAPIENPQPQHPPPPPILPTPVVEQQAPPDMFIHAPQTFRTLSEFYSLYPNWVKLIDSHIERYKYFYLNK